MEQLIPALVSLGAGGVISYVLIRYTIPSLIAAFRDEMKAEREDHKETTAQLVGQLGRNTAAVETVGVRMERLELVLMSRPCLLTYPPPLSPAPVAGLTDPAAVLRPQAQALVPPSPQRTRP